MWYAALYLWAAAAVWFALWAREEESNAGLAFLALFWILAPIAGLAALVAKVVFKEEI